MSFRQQGGINRAPKNNIVHNNYATSNNQSITNLLGAENSKTVSKSHMDLSGNSLLNTQCVYFMDGTVQCSAPLPPIPGPPGPVGPGGPGIIQGLC